MEFIGRRRRGYNIPPINRTAATVSNDPELISPRSGSTVDGTCAAGQTDFFLAAIGENAVIKNEWFVEGLEIAVTYESDFTGYNSMGLRFFIPEDGKYSRECAAYPASDDQLTDNGDGTFTLVYTFQDILDNFAMPDRNQYSVDFSNEEIFANVDLFGIRTRNTGESFFNVLSVVFNVPAPVETPELTAAPTASPVLINGTDTSFDAYLINDNNYFKLRDIAYILSGTEAQFEVEWDAENNAIILTSGQEYTPVGGEMTAKGEDVKNPAATESKVILDGEEISITAYLIDGNNYFKLRDIGKAFDFNVSWDGENDTILIETSESYTED